MFKTVESIIKNSHEVWESFEAYPSVRDDLACASIKYELQDVEDRVRVLTGELEHYTGIVYGLKKHLGLLPKMETCSCCDGGGFEGSMEGKFECRWCGGTGQTPVIEKGSK